MSTLISVTGISTKTQSSSDWKAKTGTLAFDINDISSVILRNTGNTYSYFEVTPFSDSKNNSSKQEYRVSDSLASIATQSTGLVMLTVTSRRSKTVSYNAVFVVSKMSQRLEVANGGGTKFWYMEDGDALPVEYTVSDTIASIIGQTNSSVAFLVRNGLSLTSGYIELGGDLIKETLINLDTYGLTLSTTTGGYFSSYVMRPQCFVSQSANLDVTAEFGSGFGYGKDAIIGLRGSLSRESTTFQMQYSIDETDGFTVGGDSGSGYNEYLKINQDNPNGEGILESLPTYDYTPVESANDRLIAVADTGEFYNTDIKPSDIKKEHIQVACSDEITALSAGTGKLTFRMPFAMTLTDIRASLTTAQAANGGGGIFTVDVNESGVSILSTKLTIDNTEKTSTTAAVPAVISDAALADDAEITVDIDQIGDGTATGLKVTLIGTRA